MSKIAFCVLCHTGCPPVSADLLVLLPGHSLPVHLHAIINCVQPTDGERAPVQRSCLSPCVKKWASPNKQSLHGYRRSKCIYPGTEAQLSIRSNGPCINLAQQGGSWTVLYSLTS